MTSTRVIQDNLPPLSYKNYQLKWNEISSAFHMHYAEVAFFLREIELHKTAGVDAAGLAECKLSQIIDTHKQILGQLLAFQSELQNEKKTDIRGLIDNVIQCIASCQELNIDYLQTLVEKLNRPELDSFDENEEKISHNVSIVKQTF